MICCLEFLADWQNLPKPRRSACVRMLTFPGERKPIPYEDKAADYSQQRAVHREAYEALYGEYQTPDGLRKMREKHPFGPSGRPIM